MIRNLASLDADRVLAAIVSAGLVAGICLALAGLGGCVHDEPPLFVTATTPEIPPECDPGKPVVRQVKPDLPGGWASDAAAVKDREAWRTAYRDAQGQRVTCFQRLQVLLPQPQPGKPQDGSPRVLAAARR